MSKCIYSASRQPAWGVIEELMLWILADYRRNTKNKRKYVREAATRRAVLSTLTDWLTRSVTFLCKWRFNATRPFQFRWRCFSPRSILNFVCTFLIGSDLLKLQCSFISSSFFCSKTFQIDTFAGGFLFSMLLKHFFHIRRVIRYHIDEQSTGE